MWPSWGRALPDSARLLALDLGAEPILLGPQLRSELLAEVVGLEDRAHLEGRVLPGHRVRAALQPRHRLVHRFHLPDPEPRDELLRLRERAVHHGLPAALPLEALALRARVQALAGHHDAGLDQFLVVVAHLGE